MVISFGTTGHLSASREQKSSPHDLFKPSSASILPASQTRAQVAELADALGSGPSGVLLPVEVQVLSWALCRKYRMEPFGIPWNFEGFFLLMIAYSS